MCDRLVNYVLKHDSQDKFRLIALQSKTAKELLRLYGKEASDLDTLYVITDFATNKEKLFQRSSAIIIIGQKTRGFLKVLSLGWVIPQFIRDFIFNLEARNRYRFFGKYSACKVPTSEDLKKFIEYE